MEADRKSGKSAGEKDSSLRSVGVSVNPGRDGSKEKPVRDDFGFNSTDKPFATQISESRKCQKNPSRPQRRPTPRHEDADECRPTSRQDQEPDESPDDGRRLKRTPPREPAERLE